MKTRVAYCTLKATGKLVHTVDTNMLEAVEIVKALELRIDDLSKLMDLDENFCNAKGEKNLSVEAVMNIYNQFRRHYGGWFTFRY